MDDLKLFAKDDNDLEDLPQTVKKFSDDFGMSFGLDKRGKLTGTISVELDQSTVIKDLEHMKCTNILVLMRVTEFNTQQ